MYFPRQRGTLVKDERKRSGDKWRGRFRVRNTKGETKEVCVTLGLVSEMSELQARKLLDEVIQKANSQAGYVRHFGVRGTLRQLRPGGIGPVQHPGISAGNHRGSIGTVSELIVAVDLLHKGFQVFRSLNPQSACDLVCLIGEDFIRVEVKTEVKGAVDISRNEGKFDVLAVVSRTGEVRYAAHSGINSRWVDFESLCGMPEGKTAN